MFNFNAVTKKVFSPSNQEHLDEHKTQFDLTSDQWAGFKQWKDAGRKVKKGAKGCKIFIYCEKKEKNEKGEQLKNSQGEDAKKNGDEIPLRFQPGTHRRDLRRGAGETPPPCYVFFNRCKISDSHRPRDTGPRLSVWTQATGRDDRR